ncbi:MAG TPA: T9SS type A sorting domain-containing protein [Flavisolibacter sp.]|nr:T9SS type A sorting domain-containing protein [Flavisolibacter sp.]
MIQFYQFKKSFCSLFRNMSFCSKSVLSAFTGLSVWQSQGRQVGRFCCLLFLIVCSQVSQAQTPPADGLYTFQSATSNSDGTYTTADGFFRISGNNGSSNLAAADDVAADGFGAFMNDPEPGTSGTSYLEIKVKNGGSFQLMGSVIGDYSSGGSHDFYDVYASGWANGVEIARTPLHNSTGRYEADYHLDFSVFAGKVIDAFRVYYSWNNGTLQTDFNLQDMTISGASLTPPATLPVTWLSFTAKKQDKAVQLNWSTATEQNTKDFVVQHSTNGSNWNTLGSVMAAGNSGSVQVYSFVHQFPARGVNYYRILQRDIDARKSYSKVVSVDVDGTSQSLHVFPNPVTEGTITIKLQNATSVQIYNSLGTIVLQKTINSGAQQLAVGNLPKGVYTIKAEGKTASFIVQ